jgi:hypothetical protein
MDDARASMGRRNASLQDAIAQCGSNNRAKGEGETIPCNRPPRLCSDSDGDATTRVGTHQSVDEGIGLREDGSDCSGGNPDRRYEVMGQLDGREAAAGTSQWENSWKHSGNGGEQRAL